MPRVRLGRFAVIAALATGGCAASVAVPEAPYAATPLCADVILAMPGELGDLRSVPAAAQAATAWTDGTRTVVVRCGVEPPGPSTEHCQQVAAAGATVDWLTIPADSGWVFVTYGRDPAVQLIVPEGIEAPDELLTSVSSAVSLIPATRTCA